ncbi:reverse transcriptase domain-containing protein [Peribacillus loiseleuriae]|uniref:reverse transcriptase domain-containing protein n=1 Tax=Peribacillus loiseleuriae TaxID=1679170 RepID=UPI0037F9479C
MYSPKHNSNKKRPLGIPEYEDKIVQKGITKILNTIYENDFLDCSFRFRPNRSCHDALKILNHYIEKKSVNYVVDVDIKGFFYNVEHMMEFLKLRISDPNLLRIIGRFLNCGKSKQGNFRVKRKSSRKKVQGKLKESKEWLKNNRNKDIHIFKRSLIGYYNYYCNTDNTQSVNKFKDKIGYILFKWLNRRSQRKSFTWDKFRLFLNKYPLPSPRVKVNIYDLRKEISYIL